MSFADFFDDCQKLQGEARIKKEREYNLEARATRATATILSNLLKTRVSMKNPDLFEETDSFDDKVEICKRVKFQLEGFVLDMIRINPDCLR